MATIRVSEKLRRALAKRKFDKYDRYEDIIWDLLENDMELSKETKKHIAQAEKDFKEGKFKSLDQIIKERGI